jgi:hypothetical protein
VSGLESVGKDVAGHHPELPAAEVGVGNKVPFEGTCAPAVARYTVVPASEHREYKEPAT